jgi:glycosyltransferase involved in cell wall biosynthesis
MTVTPEISIIVPSFNPNADTFRVAIKSIAEQSYSNFECLIVDESTDINVTSLICDTVGEDPRFQVITPDRRIGLAASLNLGLSMARGEFAARMDTDDKCMTHRLFEQHSFFKKNPTISIVGSAVNIIDGSDQTIAQRSYPIDHEHIIKQLSFLTPIAHPTVMFRTSSVRAVGGYDPTLKFCEDLDLWLRCAAAGLKFSNIPEVLLEYRSVTHNRSRGHWNDNARVRFNNPAPHFKLHKYLGIMLIGMWRLLHSVLASLFTLY